MLGSSVLLLALLPLAPQDRPTAASPAAERSAQDRPNADRSTEKGKTPPQAAIPLRPLGRRVLLAAPVEGKKPLVATRAPIDAKTSAQRIASLGADTWVLPLGTRNLMPVADEILGAAKAQKLSAWFAIRPPSLGGNSEPHRGDFRAWARRVADLGRKHENLKALLIQDLDAGVNLRYLHPEALATMRRSLNAAGLSLIGSCFDPVRQFHRHSGASLDALISIYTNTNDLRGLTLQLQGAKALAPEGTKLLGGFTCGQHVPQCPAATGPFLSAAIKHGLQHAEGAFVDAVSLVPEGMGKEDRERALAIQTAFARDPARKRDGKER